MAILKTSKTIGLSPYIFIFALGFVSSILLTACGGGGGGGGVGTPPPPPASQSSPTDQNPSPQDQNPPPQNQNPPPQNQNPPPQNQNPTQRAPHPNAASYNPPPQNQNPTPQDPSPSTQTGNFQTNVSYKSNRLLAIQALERAKTKFFADYKRVDIAGNYPKGYDIRNKKQVRIIPELYDNSYDEPYILTPEEEAKGGTVGSLSFGGRTLYWKRVPKQEIELSENVLPSASVESQATDAWDLGWTGKGVKVGVLDRDDSHGFAVRFVVKAVAPEADVRHLWSPTERNFGASLSARLRYALEDFQASGHHIVVFPFSEDRTSFHSTWEKTFTQNQKYSYKHMLPSQIETQDGSWVQNPKAFDKNMLIVLPAGNDGRPSGCQSFTGGSRTLKDCKIAAVHLFRLRNGDDYTVFNDVALNAIKGEIGTLEARIVVLVGADGQSGLLADLHARNPTSQADVIKRRQDIQATEQELVQKQTALRSKKAELEKMKAANIEFDVTAHPNAGDRILFVGSLADIAGTNSNASAQMAGYSVTAGEEFKNDFIVTYDNIYTDGSGTSFASPKLAGAAALVRQKFPNLDGAGLKQVLLQTADDLGAVGADPIFGMGRLNLLNALSPQGKVVIR